MSPTSLPSVEATPRANHGGRPQLPSALYSQRHLALPCTQSKDLALAYSALPAADLPPMATKPVKPSSFRAFFTAFDQAFKPFFSHCFRACAEAFLDTILPFLFFISLSFVMPLIVFCFFPEKTRFLPM